MNEYSAKIEDDVTVNKPTFWIKTKKFAIELVLLMLIYIIFTFDMVKGILASVVPLINNIDGIFSLMVSKIIYALIFSITFIAVRKLVSGLRYEF